MRTIVLAERLAENALAPRTVRAIRRKIESAQPVVALSRSELVCELEDAREPVWIISAGAWPCSSTPLLFPPPSATGRPLCAVGSCSTEGNIVSPWQRLLSSCGGDLDAVVDSAQCTAAPESVYLEEPLIGELAERLGGLSFSQAFWDLIRAKSARTIRWHPIDVGFDDRLRVVQVITSLQRGGAERVVLDLAETLPNHGVCCRVIVTGRPVRSAFTLPVGLIDVSEAPGGRAGRLQAAAEAACNFHADVVHAHLLHRDDLVAFRRANLPVLLTVHNMPQGWQPGLSDLTPDDVSVAVACSHAVERQMLTSGIEAVTRTVWNGIDVGRYRRTPQLDARAREMRRRWGIGTKDLVLLAIANPRPQKRLHRLPAVLREVRERIAGFREVWLVIAGEAGEFLPEAIEADRLLQNEILSQCMGNRIIRAGSVEDTPALIAAADVLVSTSAWEGLSLAMLEALAGGVPVVATDVGGAGEIAEKNAGIALIPSNFEDAEAAAAILDVITGDVPKPLNDMRDFRREVMAFRYAQLYPRAIQLANPREPRVDIWLVTNNFSTGGAQSSARRLLLEFARRGLSVRASVIQEDPENPTVGRQALEVEGITVHAVRCRSDGDSSVAVQDLLAEMDRVPPRAVLMWNLLMSWKVLLAELLLDVRLVDVSPGEMYFASMTEWFATSRTGSPFRNPIEYAARLSGAVVKYEGERELAERVLGCAVDVICNGVTVPPICPTHRPEVSPLVLGTSARLSPQKKLEELFEALRAAADRMPPYVLRIAGGPDGECNEAYAADLRVAATGLNVEWLGNIADVQSFLTDLDLFVMIAEPAGCSNASLEAMAAGLPVVGTDHGGFREQVVHGETGLIVPRGNPLLLSDALVEACSDPARLRTWGENGWNRARELFSVERMADGYMRLCFETEEEDFCSPGEKMRSSL